MYIKFNNNKYKIKTHKYNSILSVINEFLDTTSHNLNIEDLYLDYNGNYLSNDLSLDKYNINDDTELNLNIKLKGGNSFFTFFKDHYIIVILVFIIALLPLFILPTGFIPSLATLIENIIKKTTESFGTYLVCVLGKKTLYNRILWLIVVIKYIILFLMIFITITFPITLLCVTIKGHEVTDTPSSICGPVKKANMVGLILTVCFIMFYGFYRMGDIITSFFINIFKKFYITDTLLNPILNGILKLYDSYKYLPIYFTPFIGIGLKAYFIGIDSGLIGFQTLLATVMQYGCKSSFDSKSFGSLLNKHINQSINFVQDNPDKSIKNSSNSPSQPIIDSMCTPDISKCCNPSNFFNIANTIKRLIQDPTLSTKLKANHMYPIFILIIEGLYEHLLKLSELSEHIPTAQDERIKYFKKILNSHSNNYSNDTKTLIKEYIHTTNLNLLNPIEQHMKNDVALNQNNIQQINDNLLECEELMYDYSKQTGTKFSPGNSLFKIVLKYIFINILCNVSQTSKSSLDLIQQMNDVHNISDMIKAGASSGTIIGFGYFIALIVLIIMGILGKY